MVKIKSWDHTSLAVFDMDASVSFYVRAFEFTQDFADNDMADAIRRMMGLEDIDCTLVQLSHPVSRQRLELIEFRGHDRLQIDRPLGAGSGHIGFEVDDIKAAMEQVTGLGATPVGQITDFPEGRSVYFNAPGGSFFELLEPL